MSGTLRIPGSAHPWAAALAAAKRMGTNPRALAAEVVDHLDVEELAIVNQVHLDDQIERGQYLKLPRR